MECRNGKWNETVINIPDCVGECSPDMSVCVCVCVCVCARFHPFYIFHVTFIKISVICFKSTSTRVHVARVSMYMYMNTYLFTLLNYISFTR